MNYIIYNIHYIEVEVVGMCVDNNNELYNIETLHRDSWCVCCCKVMIIATVLHIQTLLLLILLQYITQPWLAGQVSQEVGGHTTNMNGVPGTQKKVESISPTSEQVLPGVTRC